MTACHSPTSKVSPPTPFPKAVAALTRRDERPRRSLSVYHAYPNRSLCMFLSLHREMLSIIRPTDTRRRSRRFEGKHAHQLIHASCLTRLQLITTAVPASFVHCSSQLVDRCLEIVDKELYVHLRSKNLSAEIYAFPCEPQSPFFSSPQELTPSRIDLVRLYTAPRRDPQALGVSAYPGARQSH